MCWYGFGTCRDFSADVLPPENGGLLFMTVYLVSKKKNRIYKSEDIVAAISGKTLYHNEKGAPYLDDGFISITDTKNYWACAFSDVRVGLDMEELSRAVSPAVVKKLHKAEREYLEPLSFGSREWKEEFLSIWTMKEAYIKYLGIGLSAGLGGFCVLDDRQYKLKTALYSEKHGSLIFGASEPMEIKGFSYDAPMNRSALEAGADILDMFGCSAKVLRNKLIDRGYGEDESREAVEKLIDRGFLNDEEYARSLGQKYALRGYSSKRIEAELKRKGVGPEDADSEASKYREGDRERARAVAFKMASGAEQGDKLKGKIARKLASLGYDTYLVYDIIQKLKY